MWGRRRERADSGRPDFAFVDPETRSLLRTCLTWHVELLRKSGDAEAAANAAQALQGIEAIPS